MFRLLIDTCVWLDLAKDARHETLLTALETLVGGNYVKLILPRIVIAEFDRNKARILEDSKKSLGSVIKRMRAVSEALGDPAKTRRFLEHLGEIDHALPRAADTSTRTIARIETLFAAANVVETSDAILAKAAKRGIEKRAPFHRGKNSIDDAVLIETYAEALASEKVKDVRLSFVTHNKNDFSLTAGDERLPHEHIAEHFDGKRSFYFLNLGDALHLAEPDILEHTKFEEEYHEQPRSLAEISEAIELLFDQVWYNRHQNLRIMIERGQHKVAEYPKGKKYHPGYTLPEVWKGALEAAKQVEQRRGKENLGPWDDFEWGMINGKLSALRWVLGDEWDMLDT